jgi:hypothetical protein
MSAASRSTRRRDSSIDAPRALLNAMVWFTGRHNQGFHFADLDVAIAFGNAVVAVLVVMGMTSDSLKPIRRRVLEEGFPNG